jgi:hypothetical protein
MTNLLPRLGLGTAVTLACFGILASPLESVIGAESSGLVRIGNPVGGHIHPAMCLTKNGTLVVTYGQVNHRDLRVSRSLRISLMDLAKRLRH